MFRRVCSPPSTSASGRRGVALWQVADPPNSSDPLLLRLLREEELEGLVVRFRLCSGDSLGNLTEVRFCCGNPKVLELRRVGSSSVTAFRRLLQNFTT